MDTAWLKELLEHSCYLLALLNPVSKVMFLAACGENTSPRQNFELSWKSSLAALLILLTVAAAGQFILSRIFRIELFALQITGGMVVFTIGWNAIQTGRFTNAAVANLQTSLTDLSIVPLAAPLIAGPGMIAAVIASAVARGFALTIGATVLALAVNFVFMVYSRKINTGLGKLHLLGPVVRLTGLVIAAISMQMILNGLADAIRPFFG